MTKEQAEEIWKRFDADVSDAVLRAVSGAFAFVACADAHLDDREVGRFLRWVHERPEFAALRDTDLEPRFRELAAAFQADFEEGVRRAASAVAAVKNDPEGRDLVLRAAQIAMVADEKLQTVEEVAFGRVCQALGVDPREW